MWYNMIIRFTWAETSESLYLVFASWSYSLLTLKNTWGFPLCLFVTLRYTLKRLLDCEALKAVAEAREAVRHHGACWICFKHFSFFFSTLAQTSGIGLRHPSSSWAKVPEIEALPLEWHGLRLARVDTSWQPLMCWRGLVRGGNLGKGERCVRGRSRGYERFENYDECAMSDCKLFFFRSDA